jgi:hypothetical protein
MRSGHVSSGAFQLVIRQRILSPQAIESGIMLTICPFFSSQSLTKTVCNLGARSLRAAIYSEISLPARVGQ